VDTVRQRPQSSRPLSSSRFKSTKEKQLPNRVDSVKLLASNFKALSRGSLASKTSSRHRVEVSAKATQIDAASGTNEVRIQVETPVSKTIPTCPVSFIQTSPLQEEMLSEDNLSLGSKFDIRI